MVIPGQIGYDLDAKAVLLQGSFLGADVEQYRTNLTGTIISGLTTGVKQKLYLQFQQQNHLVDISHYMLSI
ncbi:MAG: hypothetical protein CM15mV13_2990 [uncultured marine virus]|nr:MAG: hypothetical protein CM15mV13_2990 [uncultured marine virus]